MNAESMRAMLHDVDDDDDDDDSREFNDGLDENCVGDDDDRRRLASMTAMEREQEMINRREKRTAAKIRFEIENRLKMNVRERNDDDSRRQQTTTRQVHTTTVEESITYTRTSDNIKSNSLLRLSDIVCQNILLHPFLSLRRTCQVNRKCSAITCVQPFSLVTFLYHQQRKHGLQALYKGLTSELLVKGFTLGAETAIANYADWPREVGSSKRYLEDSFKVLALRGMSIALSTPLLCSSVIETVQSAIVVRDRPSFIDCLRDGFFRLLHLRSTPSNRLIPIWMLVVPTVFYHLSHSLLTQLATKFLNVFRRDFMSTKTKTRKMRATRKHRAGPSKHSIFDNTKWQPEDLTVTYDPNETSSNVDNIEIDSEKISTSIMARLMADVALLPIEIVLNCLYIQGTRTIIDNCDETTVVLPVLTNYDGFSDCYQSILRFEGNLGLYKGLGAIVLQYSVHYILFRSLYYLLREFHFNDSDNNGNAPSRQKSAPPTQQTSSNVEDLLVRLGSNRHSTPNNPMLSNRLNESDFDPDDTPKRFPRI